MASAGMTPTRAAARRDAHRRIAPAGADDSPAPAPAPVAEAPVSPFPAARPAPPPGSLGVPRLTTRDPWRDLHPARVWPD